MRQVVASAPIASCPASTDERVLQLCAAAWAAVAKDANETARTQAVAEGSRAADRLILMQPESGTAWALFAYIVSMRPDGGTPVAIAALEASYRLTPFLRQQGFWRIWYGSHHWKLVDPGTRRRLLEEALWLQGIGDEDRMGVQRAIAGTPPYLTVALRAPGRGGEGLPLSASDVQTVL